jgi:acyl-coenzyme A synthetase/AMP-(fatty) acid ligase/thioesterase domain-containing protein/acyl carrier protein
MKQSPPFSKKELLEDFWGCVSKRMSVHGNNEFLITKYGSLTFKQVDGDSNIICQQIKNTTYITKVGIGIYLKEPRQAVKCMLAVMKSNNYFVILDVTYPELTINSMIEDANIQIILTETQYIDQVRSITGDRVLLLDLEKVDFSIAPPEINVTYSPDDIVQIMFTSGSTGKPKGAIEDYRYLIRSVYLKERFNEYKPTDRMLQLATYSYSGPHTGVFSALIVGFAICFHYVKDEGFNTLPDWIRKTKITAYQSTVTTFRSFVSVLKHDDQFPTVENFHISGEKRLSNDILLIKRHFPNVTRLRLSYSGTEMQTVSSSIVPIDLVLRNEILPSGKPHEDIKVFIWDEYGKPVPEGKEGEMVVYGDALARGYINNPELTRVKFISDAQNPIFQFFRTGDLGRIQKDGQLVHLGRIDNMVKIKGVRVELDSIDNFLSTYPGIIHVTSKAIDDENGIKRLATYFTVEEGIQVPISALRKHLAEIMPVQQIPSYFICLDSMPLTSSGKIALDQLPFPKMVRPDLDHARVSASTPTEDTLTAIWEEHIGVSGIGVIDDFFEVGGDSLIGVVIFVAIEEELGKSLPVSTLLTAPTIRKLGKIIDGELENNQGVDIIAVNSNGEKPPLFFIPGKGGFPIRIRHLVKHLNSDIPVYAFQNIIRERTEVSSDQIKQIASNFIKSILKVHPRGPFFLVGESMGGKLAYEVAQQIARSGAKPPLVFLLDTFHQESTVPKVYRNKGAWSYYRTIIKKHASIWFQSNLQGRKEYLRFYRETFLEKSTRILKQRIKKRAKGSEAPSLGEQAWSERENCEASKAYEVKPYSGKVVFIMAQRGTAANSNITHGWDKVGIKDLVVEKLDCYHGSMLFEPAVSELADIINKHI